MSALLRWLWLPAGLVLAAVATVSLLEGPADDAELRRAAPVSSRAPASAREAGAPEIREDSRRALRDFLKEAAADEGAREAR